MVRPLPPAYSHNHKICLIYGRMGVTLSRVSPTLPLVTRTRARMIKWFEIVYKRKAKMRLQTMWTNCGRPHCFSLYFEFIYLSAKLFSLLYRHTGQSVRCGRQIFDTVWIGRHSFLKTSNAFHEFAIFKTMRRTHAHLVTDIDFSVIDCSINANSFDKIAHLAPHGPKSLHSRDQLTLKLWFLWIILWQRSCN